jgi:hypothetical protein
MEKGGAEIKVIAGTIDGTKGPIKDLKVDVEYFDVKLAPGKAFEHTTERSWKVFAYVIEGSSYVGDQLIESQQCAMFGDGGSVKLETERGVRFLLISGKPLNEPVAWGGPIVMNTRRVRKGIPGTEARHIHQSRQESQAIQRLLQILKI